MFSVRQGEILIKEVKKVEGKRLNHLILAEGEATGHKHEVITKEKEGAVLYEKDDRLYLKVLSDTTTLTHPDHETISLPIGNYEIEAQREYEISEEKYRRVTD